VVFTNTSSNSIGYYWDFDNGHDTTTTNLGNVNQTFTSNVALDTFTVWLVATNGICQDSVFHLISIAQPPYIFVPNVFTPNGDNTNEVFFLDNRFLASLEVIIVNRWGNVMAIIDTPQGSWDGKTKSGADADDGVYFYKYTAVGINGDELEGQGFVTLIR
jgi:gliding motility-associated-like protein